MSKSSVNLQERLLSLSNHLWHSPKTTMSIPSPLQILILITNSPFSIFDLKITLLSKGKFFRLWGKHFLVLSLLCVFFFSFRHKKAPKKAEWRFGGARWQDPASDKRGWWEGANSQDNIHRQISLLMCWNIIWLQQYMKSSSNIDPQGNARAAGAKKPLQKNHGDCVQMRKR